ncbi:MAG: DUF4184 family protein [Bacteroidota bacterium]|nr:DUF4184 family protein [Bacteroidota bacterium]
MPFTFSHPAIVLPLTYTDKTMFSVTALTIGSITPDFGYFFYLPLRLNFSHTWSGILWFDLPLSIVILFLYEQFVRKQLVDHLPSFLYRRFAGFKKRRTVGDQIKRRLIIVSSLLIGITSHVLWDKITHKGAWLAEDPTEIYPVLWDTSTIIGGLLITIIIIKMRRANVIRQTNIVLYWLPIFTVMLTFIIFRSSYDSNITSLTVAGIAGLFLGLLIVSFFFSIVGNSHSKQ